MKGNLVRVGIVGLGKMGLLHACIVNVMPNVCLVALCDKGFLIRKVSRKIFPNALITDDVTKLARGNLDVVYVTTPIPSHFFIVKTIYSQNIAPNVFCEKTLASDFERANQLCELAEGGGGVNMVGFMKRFGVTFLKVKNLLEQRVLGDLLSFDAYAFSSDFAHVAEGVVSAGRGGVLGDLGSHVIDLASWFFGDLKVETAQVLSLGAGGSEDSATFTVRGPNRLVGKFDISWCKKDFRMPEFGFVLRGTKGIVDVDDDTIKLELVEKQPQRWFRHDLGDSVGFLVGGSEYYREDAHFLECVAGGGVAEPGFRTASKVDFLIDQVKSRGGRK